jgi:hypothetical protein
MDFARRNALRYNRLRIYAATAVFGGPRGLRGRHPDVAVLLYMCSHDRIES